MAEDNAHYRCPGGGGHRVEPLAESVSGQFSEGLVRGFGATGAAVGAVVGATEGPVARASGLKHWLRSPPQPVTD